MTIRYSDDGTRLEQTGWRDEWISRRHRTWGYDLPATDVDFMLIEYRSNKPAALIEYKTFGSMKYLGEAKALKDHTPVANLATMAQIPAFIIAYDQQTVMFKVKSTNNKSINSKEYNWVDMDENTLIAFLKYVRMEYVGSRL